MSQQLDAIKRRLKRAVTQIKLASTTISDVLDTLQKYEQRGTAGHPDGPAEEGKFFYGGERYLFGTLEWKLLKALWGKSKVPYETAREGLYPKEESAADGRFRKRLFDTRKKIEKHQLPFKIVMTENYLSLVMD